MNLAVFLNLKFYYDGEKYTSEENYFQYWLSFTDCFEKVILCVPVQETKENRGYFNVNLDREKVEICHLPYYDSPMTLYMRAPLLIRAVKRIIAENIDRWDVVGAIVPNLIGFYFLSQAKAFSKPRFAYITGNHRISSKYQFRGLKKWGALVVSFLIEFMVKRLSVTTPTFVIGKELYDRFKKNSNLVFSTVTAMISERDIQEKVNVRPDPLHQIRLLYVGGLTPWKGVSYLIDSMNLLRHQYGLDFALTLVGSGEDEPHLRQKVREFALEDSVHFAGFIPYGEKIMPLYKDADAFIVPSLSEGIPKTILESMANGVPVIATSVGGIPEVIKDGENGLLISPADPAAIACAVHQLMSSEALRRRLATNALQTIREYTTEKQRDKVVVILNDYIHRRKL